MAENTVDPKLLDLLRCPVAFTIPTRATTLASWNWSREPGWYALTAATSTLSAMHPGDAGG